MLADDARQHREQARHDRVQVEDLGRQELLAAEREQLPREGRGAIGRLADLADVVHDRIVGLQPLLDEVGVADDGGEQVVEIVRDAAGEAADRVHLLRLAQLLLAIEQHAARLPVAERVADRTLEMRADELLLDVVGGSFAQCRLVEIPAAVAGDQDEWLRGAVFLGGVNQAQAGAVGQPLVDEIDVVIIAADAAQAFDDRADHLECQLEMRVAQRHLDELARLRVVIDRQDPNEMKIWKPRRVQTSMRSTDMCMSCYGTTPPALVSSAMQNEQCEHGPHSCPFHGYDAQSFVSGQTRHFGCARRRPSRPGP